MNFLNVHRNSMDELTPHEREEIDHAIALSLTEEEEQIARALIKSLEVQPSPRHNQANAIRTDPLASISRDGFCKGCNAQIGQEERSLKSMGAVWHPDCFLCHACGLPITNKQFSIGEDQPFHESCYREHHHPKCDVCKNFPPRSTDAVEFQTNAFWMQKYCPSQEQDGTPEIDHAIALSLTEEEEEEQIARAVMKSLEVQSPPRHNQANAIRTNPLASTSRDGFCKGCNAQIGQDERSLKSMGAVWHPDCFLCHACGLPITDKQFSIGEDQPFHESCYREHHHPKCDVCKNFVRSSLIQSNPVIRESFSSFDNFVLCPMFSGDGPFRAYICWFSNLQPPRSTDVVEFQTNAFWMQKYCPSHEQDGTPEIDHAIALSLTEEEEEEQIARAVMKSLEVQSPPWHNQANAIRTNPLASTSRDGFCKGCNAQIGQEERSLKSMGAVWHPDCFLCHACGLPITDKQFSIGEDQPFHESCYREHHHPKCDVCKNFLPRSTDVVEFRTNTFWMQKYCPSHEQDGTPVCCSCTRLEPRDMAYITLSDGRKLCLECLNSAITNSQQSQPLYCKICEFFRGLDMEVEQQIPLHLVERQALNEAMEGEKNGHHHLPETRGICLMEDQSVPKTIRKQPAGTSSWTIEMVMEPPHKLDRSCDVTAILILCGLPRLLTGSILAHEMMHAWLRLSGYPKLSPKVEEGICQVMAHKWLNMETGSSSSGAADVASLSPSDEQLGAFLKCQIEEDSSPNYGEGFKLGYLAVQKFGLKRTLDYIRRTGSFPSS